MRVEGDETEQSEEHDTARGVVRMRENALPPANAPSLGADWPFSFEPAAAVHRRRSAVRDDPDAPSTWCFSMPPALAGPADAGIDAQLY